MSDQKHANSLITFLQKLLNDHKKWNPLQKRRGRPSKIPAVVPKKRKTIPYLFTEMTKFATDYSITIPERTKSDISLLLIIIKHFINEYNLADKTSKIIEIYTILNQLIPLITGPVAYGNQSKLYNEFRYIVGDKSSPNFKVFSPDGKQYNDFFRLSSEGRAVLKEKSDLNTVSGNANRDVIYSNDVYSAIEMGFDPIASWEQQAIALQIMVGSRVNEILNGISKFSEFKHKDGNWIHVVGVSKDKELRGDLSGAVDSKFVIDKPLIARKSAEFLDLYKKFREAYDPGEFELQNAIKRINNQLKSYFPKSKPKTFTSHALRRVYSNLSYELVGRLQPGHPSLTSWTSRVLGHQGVGATSLKYQRLYVVLENSRVADNEGKILNELGVIKADNAELKQNIAEIKDDLIAVESKVPLNRKDPIISLEGSDGKTHVFKRNSRDNSGQTLDRAVAMLRKLRAIGHSVPKSVFRNRFGFSGQIAKQAFDRLV